MTRASRVIVGVDWAASDLGKCGLALGTLSPTGLALEAVLTAAEAGGAAPVIAEWLSRDARALLAIDAPLGWPAGLSRGLACHEAGSALGPASGAGAFFTRETDRSVKAAHGKTPLEVGADRIARTAYSALALLEEVRRTTGRALDLAWSPARGGVLEVYPAATLKVLSGGGRLPPYKKPEDLPARRKIVKALAREVRLSRAHVRRAHGSDHLLDAIACVVAGADFARGLATPPTDAHRSLARREGWIWVRDASAQRTADGTTTPPGGVLSRTNDERSS